MGDKTRQRILLAVLMACTGLLVWYWFWGRIQYQISQSGACSKNLLFLTGFISLVLLYPLLQLSRFSIRPETSEQEKKKAFFILGPFFFVINWVGTWAFLLLLNGALDKSPGVFHEVKVIEKKDLSTSKISSFNLYVESWEPTSEKSRIKLTVEDYDHLDVKNGDVVIVETGQGALGCEWIRGVSKKPPGGET